MEQGGEINDIFELISSNPNLALTAFQDSTNNNDSLDLAPAVAPLRVSHNSQVSHYYSPIYKGEFGFEVAFEENGQSTKSCSWTYSSSLKRLYVKDKTVIPFLLKVMSYAPYVDENLYVRAQLQFSDRQYLQDIVSRCPNHTTPDHPTNICFPNPEHVVRADGLEEVEYLNDGAKAVRFKFSIPLTGSSHGYARLRFMCPNSCPGGMNRRSTDLIFILLNSSNMEVGRFSTPIKICSCPGRDRQKDEEKDERGRERRNFHENSPFSGGFVSLYPSNKRKRTAPEGQMSVAPKKVTTRVILDMAGPDLADWIERVAKEVNERRWKDL
ncbi:cellular tumor antigen p53-like [Artemia franciscana]|uniref:cellular tumor antigen p53-like n=1 Tax=Artemia franciscana TaxID=6661 RepID=UPI0032DB9BA9